MTVNLKKQLKVAKIIDEYSIVINGGKNFGIAPGDTLEIFVPGSEIKDPDTGESLGSLDFVKAKLVAKDVFPKMSVCRNQDYMSSIVAGLAAAMIGSPAELNVAAEDISGGYGELDDKIRVGDLVRKIQTNVEDTAIRNDFVTGPLAVDAD